MKRRVQDLYEHLDRSLEKFELIEAKLSKIEHDISLMKAMGIGGVAWDSSSPLTPGFPLALRRTGLRPDEEFTE